MVGLSTGSEFLAELKAYQEEKEKLPQTAEELDISLVALHPYAESLKRSDILDNSLYSTAHEINFIRKLGTICYPTASIHYIIECLEGYIKGAEMRESTRYLDMSVCIRMAKERLEEIKKKRKQVK